MSTRAISPTSQAPWPVRRGGWVLRLYEHSLGLAFVLLFLLSWVGHAFGGYGHSRGSSSQASHRPTRRLPRLGAILVRIVPELAERIPRDRVDGVAGGLPAAARSPESKPVHAPHRETGR